MRRILLAILVLAVYVLHQDVWSWRSAHPLRFGVLPATLAYHAAYTIAASILLWTLVKLTWPERVVGLERRTGAPPESVRRREEPRP